MNGRYGKTGLGIAGFSAMTGALALAGALLASGARAEDGCAKLNLTAGATKCSSLKGEFDVSACDVGAKTLKAKFKCSKDEAVARASRGGAAFLGHVSRSAGAWGGGDWKVDGLVMMEKTTATKVARAAPSSVKFTPAGAVAHEAAAPAHETAHEKVAEKAAEKVEAAASHSPASETPAATGFQFSAYFDAYYAHNFNRPAAATPSTAAGTLPNAQTALHYYDYYANQLGLNLVELTVKHVRKETSFLVDFDFGDMADINAPTTTSGVPDSVSKHIGQAVFSYTPSWAPGLTIDAGKMATHVGLEVIKARDNWNYTRSTLFAYGIPLWHTGVHVGYEAIAKKLAVGAYLYQGWNTLNDNNTAPTLGAQVKFTPSDSLTVIYNYIGGAEQANVNDNLKQVHDLNATVTLSSTVSLAMDFITGSEDGLAFNAGADAPIKATWSAFELGAKLQVTPAYSISPRWEIYNDPQGYTLNGVATSPAGQSLMTYTLTQALQVSEGFETRFELRLDHSSLENRFTTKDGVSANQATAVIGLLYSM
jgi:hypothetical protein